MNKLKKDKKKMNQDLMTSNKYEYPLDATLSRIFLSNYVDRKIRISLFSKNEFI
jgi:hypothetical protein